jgi:hypothetical protein
MPNDVPIHFTNFLKSLTDEFNPQFRMYVIPFDAPYSQKPDILYSV